MFPKKTENFLQELKHLLSKSSLPFDLSPSKLQITRLAGLTNQVYKLESKDWENPLLLHCFSHEFSLFIDHSFENQIVQTLSASDLYSKLYYCDENFRIVEFYPGRQIFFEELYDENILKGLMFQLSLIHTIFSKEKNIAGKGALLDNIINNHTFLQRVFEEIGKRMEDFPENKRESLKAVFQQAFSTETQEKLQETLQKIKKTQKKFNISPEIFYCFCHNDLNNTNILVQDFTTPFSLRIIDYEYSSFNYLAYEFANMFNEMAMDYGFSKHPFFFYNKDKFPEKSFRIKVFAAYLFYQRIWSRKIGEKPDFYKVFTSNSLDFERFYNENSEIIDGFEESTRLSVVFSHYFWLMIAGLSLNKKDLELDLCEYILKRFEFMNELLFIEEKF